jgi:hypothetical protein
MFWFEFWAAVFVTTVLGYLVFCFMNRRSRLVIRRYINPAYYEKKCPHCSMGAQYLHPDTGWGPIPVSLRMVIKGRSTLGPRQANIRSCGTCGGGGRVSTRRSLPANAVQDFGPREVNW